MVKSSKLGTMTARVTSEATKNNFATTNVGQMTTKFLSVALKIMVGLCIGEMVMITVVAGTLGFYVNKNVSILCWVQVGMVVIYASGNKCTVGQGVTASSCKRLDQSSDWNVKQQFQKQKQTTFRQ